ncbi:ribonuclease H-like domain-containing protein [Marinoscillum sp. MHG1-6]|uniref:ribonuclease H-like domain-containing protein n=1 Tax=Marinoscillum sp. MHG1-6 TaxID=2959627 RepID=UPI0021580766|nr:ribonuclease H-like domain-containing protein [Marinoscillum sp. MHG1-6]
MDHRLSNLLIVDIETVAQDEHFSGLPEDLQKHWEYKSGFLRNGDELSAEELFEARAGIYAEFGKVIVVAFGIYHQMENGELAIRVKSFASNDEKELLTTIKEFLEKKFDPETVRLCAHNGKEFDFPYLSRRMLLNGLKLPYVLDNSGKKPWEVNFLDTMEMWKFGDRKSYTSLDLLTTIFDIPSSKSELDGSKVNYTYYHETEGLKRIEKYCQGDVIATAQLYLRLNSLPLVDPKNITTVT